jgi:hypothetical protein
MGANRIAPPNPYQAAVVKWTDECIAGAEGPSEEPLVKHASQALAADLISSAGHGLGLHQTPIEDRCFGETRNSSPFGSYVLETLLRPHPGLLEAAGCIRRHS